MRLAVLFWFYKDLDLCAERLQLLRRLNPDTPIYGLYGGPPDQAEVVAKRLTVGLDDLYVFSEERDPHWKWLNGDRLIAAWMAERGGSLSWDTLVVVQWDMLVLAPLQDLFGSLKPGEVVLSGFRPFEEVASWWGWAGVRDPDKRGMLQEFRERLRADFGYAGPLWCALFIVVAFPREFLNRYVRSGPPQEGFLEYKIPTLAKLWRTPVRTDLGFNPWWAADPSTKAAPPRVRALNAVGQEVETALIEAELADPAGLRVFHPFSGPLPERLLNR